MAGSEAKRQVRRRRVFYIPGYDPIHPRRYRELYRTESASQARISGFTIGQTARTSEGPYGWHVAAEIEGEKVEAEVEVLVWSDIVRQSMSSTILGTYSQLVRTAFIYIASGALRRLMWLRKGPVIAALYPVGMLLAQLGLALLAGTLLARWVTGALSALLPVPGWLDAGIGWAIFGAVAVALLRWFKAKDGQLYAYYLMHDFAFSARWNGAYPPQLEDRMAAFGDRIAEALADPGLDEVLVVGHSSGAHLGVSILADLIRDGRRPDGPALGFLSLGQVVPMVSFLKGAHRLRADLAFLSTRDELIWVDITAPGDGCSFALCDPVAVSGVAPKGKRWPLVLSAAFSHTLSPERWRALRWRFFRLHFQYLCAFDRPGDYDYFRVTAGPMTLADRFAGRKPSASRIDVPASKYTSRAA